MKFETFSDAPEPAAPEIPFTPIAATPRPAGSGVAEWRPEWKPKQKRTLRRMKNAGQLPPDYNVNAPKSSPSAADLRRTKLLEDRESRAVKAAADRSIVEVGQVKVRVAPSNGHVHSGNPAHITLGITDEEVIAALKATGGIAAPAAQLLGIASSTLRARMKKPAIVEALAAFEEDNKDEAEKQLRINYMLGNSTDVHFFLKQKAKDRGYGDSSTVHHQHQFAPETLREIAQATAGFIAAIREATAAGLVIEGSAEHIADAVALPGPAGTAPA